MTEQPTEQLTDLKVVASSTERPGHTTIGVVLDGAFLPIAQHVNGLVDQMRRRWGNLGGVKLVDPVGDALGSLEHRLAAVEQAHTLLTARVDELAKPPAKKPAAGKPSTSS